MCHLEDALKGGPFVWIANDNRQSHAVHILRNYAILGCYDPKVRDGLHKLQRLNVQEGHPLLTDRESFQSLDLYIKSLPQNPNGVVWMEVVLYPLALSILAGGIISTPFARILTTLYR